VPHDTADRQYRVNDESLSEGFNDWPRDLLAISHFVNREFQDCLDKSHTKMLANDAETNATVKLQQEPDNWRLAEGADASCVKRHVPADYNFGSTRRQDQWVICSGPLVEDTSLRDSFAGRMAYELSDRVHELLLSPTARTPWREPLAVFPKDPLWP